jgi:nucleoid-associated protein YgaU
MGLAKLTILVEAPNETDVFQESIEVLFNPTQVTIQKGVNWQTVPTVQRDAPLSQFTHGQPASLNLDLFFDTYAQANDVRAHTEKIFYLTTVERHGEMHRPPLCKLIWGAFRFNDWQWVLSDLQTRFTMFLESGIPVRATLSCSFKQWQSIDTERKAQGLSSADVAKMYTIRAGDTLSGIAARVFGDPRMWRYIAWENDIDNPQAIEPGFRLVIPKLTSARKATSK